MDQMKLDDLPGIGSNHWHKFDERSGEFAMNTAWKEQIDVADKLYRVVPDRALAYPEQGRSPPLAAPASAAGPPARRGGPAGSRGPRGSEEKDMHVSPSARGPRPRSNPRSSSTTPSIELRQRLRLPPAWH